MPYALLQLSLEQTIDRTALEDAGAASHSIPRPDCARLQKELFGIVVDNLDYQPAVALRQELGRRNFPTEVVDQSELPVLSLPKRGFAITLAEAGVVLVDMYGGEQLYKKEQIVFAAGGHVLHLKDVPYRNMEWVIAPGPRGSLLRDVQMVTEHRLDNVPEFRLDLFCLTETPRLLWLLAKDAVLNINGVNLTLRNRDRLDAFLLALGSLLPPAQTNLGIKKAGDGEDFLYPSVRAFEEEIIWSLYQMARKPS
jgi:hypothetical protein